MSYANFLVERYLQRGVHGVDAAWNYQFSVLRDMLDRLERVLEAETSLSPDDIHRVMRAIAYGTPSVADAELRMEQQELMANLAARVPPIPMFFPNTPATGGNRD